MKNIKHRTEEEVKKSLGKSPFRIDENKCPECGGILLINYGSGINVTFCVDCDYDYYEYDL